MTERKRTTKAERDALAAGIDERTRLVHERLDNLTTDTTDPDRAILLDAIRDELTVLDEEISELQKVAREDHSWG